MCDNKKRKLSNIISSDDNKFNIKNINTINEINNFLKIKRAKVISNLVEIDNLREHIRQLDRKLDKICDHEYEYTGESYGMNQRPPKRCCKCHKDK